MLPLVDFESRLFGRFAVSLPFVNYGGVVAADRDVEQALERAALDNATSRGWRHVELRHFDQRFAQWPARRHKVTMWLPLPPDADALWQSLDRKVRNQVRKAEKSGCVAEVGGLELLHDFYQVFAHNMRDLGTPVYAGASSRKWCRTFPASTRVFVVRVETEPVAASITVGWRDRIEVPWASALRAHNDKAPNMLLYWTMLKQAIAPARPTFDFGRSTPDESTYRFKAQWGAQPRELIWEYLGLAGEAPEHGPGSARFRLAVRAWQRLPVPVATALVPPSSGTSRDAHPDLSTCRYQTLDAWRGVACLMVIVYHTHPGAFVEDVGRLALRRWLPGCCVLMAHTATSAFRCSS